jgi:cytochrome c-type biogenesis protein CcmH/NrfG
MWSDLEQRGETLSNSGIQNVRQPKRGSKSVRRLWGVIVLLSVALVAQASEDMATGVTLFERGQFAAAQQVFEAFVRQYPTDPAGAYYLGRIAFESEQYEQAATWFEKAVQLDGGTSDCHLWLGRTYGHQAQAAKSEAFFLARKVKTHLEKAVELNPDNIEARFDLLEYYLQASAIVAGGLTKAKEQVEEIAKRDATAGRKARQRYEREDAQSLGEEITPPQNGPAGAAQ